MHDYKQLGLKMGLEIHQQLEGKKLFCQCPTNIRKDQPEFTFTRKLRAAAGETGETDIAALHEMQKGKTFVYQGYHDSTCLVEMDEEPPHSINLEALQTTLQAAQLLNAKIADAIQVMRKTVVDGSNVSGFQRTALVATDGWIDVDGKKIGIPSICLEEEACQVMERKKEYDVYNLSRLGIPLIEIATDASITTPEECRKTAEKLGMVLRSVPGMKRGIGTIRQDVNLSIKGGSRIEVKGFQEYKSIPKVVEYEVERQLKLLKQDKKIEAEVRKAEPDFATSFLRPMPGAARLYPETDIPLIHPDVKQTGNIELLEEKTEKLKKRDIGHDLAMTVTKEGKSDFLLRVAEKYRNVKSSFIAETIVSTPKTIRRKDKVDSNPTEEQFEAIFHALNEGRISKDAVYNVLVELGTQSITKPNFDINPIIAKHSSLSDAELEKELKKIAAENKGMPFNALIGKAMGTLRGKADGQKIVEGLKRLTK